MFLRILDPRIPVFCASAVRPCFWVFHLSELVYSPNLECTRLVVSASVQPYYCSIQCMCHEFWRKCNSLLNLKYLKVFIMSKNVRARPFLPFPTALIQSKSMWARCKFFGSSFIRNAGYIALLLLVRLCLLSKPLLRPTWRQVIRGGSVRLVATSNQQPTILSGPSSET
jgi:hypothetical protein